MQLKRLFNLYLLLSLPILILPIEGIGSYLGLGILAIMLPVYFLYHLNKRFDYWIYFSIIFFLSYIIAGTHNDGWLTDVRITITNILLLTFLIWCLKNVLLDRIIKALFFLNIFSFLLFFLIYFEIIPNLFFDGVLAAYHDYKTSSNPIFLFYILPFIFALNHRQADKIIFLNFIMGGVVGLLSGSLQNLILILLAHIILIFDLRRISARNVIILLCASLAFFFSLSYIDVRFVSKMKFIFDPLESSTIQTRIGDLLYIWPEATASVEKILFGSGIGVRSTVYRFNESNPGLSEYRTFLEIDNGFFYIFHRYGLIGISLFLYVHKKIMNRIKGFKAKVIFLIIIIVINFLSIHYWSHFIFPILIALILNVNYENNKQNHPLQRSKY